MSVVNAMAERIAASIENATILDAPASLGQKLTAKIPPGKFKDALSGTPIGHPLHPALVAVPIGAFTGALVLDATCVDRRASRRLIGLGIASALPAAVAGLSDWGDTLGAERRVGVAHAIANSLGLGLMTLSWKARGRGGRGTVSALVGFGIIGASGWLGGHLAYALGVGVDTTAFQHLPTDWTDACADSDLADGNPHAVTVVDVPVMLLRQNGTLHAIDDRCTHRGGPLHEGTLVDGCVQCPWHGSRFDLDQGTVERGPATRPQPVFETRVVAGRVQVRRLEERTLRTNPAH